MNPASTPINGPASQPKSIQQNLGNMQDDPSLEEKATQFQALIQSAKNSTDLPSTALMDRLNQMLNQSSVNDAHLKGISPDDLQALLTQLENSSDLQPKQNELQALLKQLKADDQDLDAAALLAILQGMQQTPAPSNTAPNIHNTSATTDTSRIANMLESVASQILVSHPDLSNGKKQVMIVLNHDVLPGAQVALSRDNGTLQIVFQASVMDTANFLSQNRPALQQFLESRLSEPVNLRVEVTSSQQSSQEQNEGRSRNQRSVLNEYNPDEENLT